MNHQDWKPVFLVNKQPEIQKPKIDYANIIKNNILNSNEDIYKPKTVDKEFSKQLIKARMDKKLTQKEVAKMLCITLKDVSEYENGTAIHDGKLVSKFKKFYGIYKKNN